MQIFYNNHCFYDINLDKIAFSGMLIEIYISIFFIIWSRFDGMNLGIYLFLIPFFVKIGLLFIDSRLNYIVVLDFEKVKTF